jgi:hypothetical protein
MRGKILLLFFCIFFAIDPLYSGCRGHRISLNRLNNYYLYNYYSYTLTVFPADSFTLGVHSCPEHHYSVYAVSVTCNGSLIYKKNDQYGTGFIRLVFPERAGRYIVTGGGGCNGFYMSFTYNLLQPLNSAPPINIEEVTREHGHVACWSLEANFDAFANQLCILTDSDELQDIRMLDLSGKTVFQKELSGSRAVVSTLTFSKGIYSIIVSTAIGRIRLKKILLY